MKSKSNLINVLTFTLIAAAYGLLLTSCATVPQEAVDARNAFANDSAQDAYDLAKTIRENQKNFLKVISEREFTTLKANTEAAYAEATTEAERVQVMADYFNAKEKVEAQLQEHARRLATAPDGAVLLGDAILALNDTANREEKLTQDALIEAVQSGFLDSLLQIIESVKNEYQVRFDTPVAAAEEPAPVAPETDEFPRRRES